MSSKNALLATQIVEFNELWGAARRAAPILQIRKLMRDKKLQSKDLAERMGVSEANISRMLRGQQNLKLDTLYLLADAIEEPLNFVIGSIEVAEVEGSPADDCVIEMESEFGEGEIDNVVDMSVYRRGVCIARQTAQRNDSFSKARFG